MHIIPVPNQRSFMLLTLQLSYPPVVRYTPEDCRANNGGFRAISLSSISGLIYCIFRNVQIKKFFLIAIVVFYAKKDLEIKKKLNLNKTFNIILIHLYSISQESLIIDFLLI